MGDTELTGTLGGITRAVTLKELRKRKVDAVRVVERSKLQAALEQLAGEGAAERAEAEKKRIAMLLQEVERLTQAKSALEHDKGLVEAERNQLKADLEQVAQELGKELGSKLKSQDVRQLVADLRRAKEEKDKTRVALDRLQAQAQQRLDEELSRSQRLGFERDTLQTTLAAHAEERARLNAELEAARGERDRMAKERDELLAERARLSSDQEDLVAEIDTLREERSTLGRESREAREALHALRELQVRQGEQFAALEQEARRLKEELEALRPKPAPEPEKPADGAAPARRPAQGFNHGFGFGGAGKRGK